MTECETFQTSSNVPLVFNLKLSCHNVFSSYFSNVVTPVLIDNHNVSHKLTVEKSSFDQIRNQAIFLRSSSGSMVIRNSCISSGKGFLNRYSKDYGMALFGRCNESLSELVTFAGFNGYGKISFYFYETCGELKNINESSNHLSDYISFYFELSESIVSYLSLANSSGASNGVEFCRTNGVLKFSNFIQISVFLIPDLHGYDPGLIVISGSETKATFDNLFIVQCKAPYFINRLSATVVSCSNIHCDEEIEIGSSLNFEGTINIGPRNSLCKVEKCQFSIKFKKSKELLLIFFTLPVMII